MSTERGLRRLPFEMYRIDLFWFYLATLEVSRLRTQGIYKFQNGSTTLGRRQTTHQTSEESTQDEVESLMDAAPILSIGPLDSHSG